MHQCNRGQSMPLTKANTSIIDGSSSRRQCKSSARPLFTLSPLHIFKPSSPVLSSIHAALRTADSPSILFNSSYCSRHILSALYILTHTTTTYSTWFFVCHNSKELIALATDRALFLQTIFCEVLLFVLSLERLLLCLPFSLFCFHRTIEFE